MEELKKQKFLREQQAVANELIQQLQHENAIDREIIL